MIFRNLLWIHSKYKYMYMYHMRTYASWFTKFTQNYLRGSFAYKQRRYKIAAFVFSNATLTPHLPEKAKSIHITQHTTNRVALSVIGQYPTQCLDIGEVTIRHTSAACTICVVCSCLHVSRTRDVFNSVNKGCHHVLPVFVSPTSQMTQTRRLSSTLSIIIVIMITLGSHLFATAFYFVKHWFIELWIISGLAFKYLLLNKNVWYLDIPRYIYASLWMWIPRSYVSKLRIFLFEL